MIHAAAVALIHENYIHARSETVSRDSDHVLRIRRAFEPVHDDQRQRIPTIFLALLPVAPATHFDVLGNLDKSFLRRWQMDSAWQQKARNRLHVPAPQPATRPEWRTIGPQA